MIFLFPISLLIGSLKISIFDLFLLKNLRINRFLAVIGLLIFTQTFLLFILDSKLSVISIIGSIRVLIAVIIASQFNKSHYFKEKYVLLCALISVLELGWALIDSRFSQFTLIPRVSGFFQPLNNFVPGSAFDPNNFCVAILLYYFILQKKKNNILLILSVLTIVVLTGSRIGIIAFGLNLILQLGKARNLILMSLLVLLGLIFSTQIMESTRTFDFMSKKDTSTTERIERLTKNALFKQDFKYTLIGNGFEGLKTRGEDYKLSLNKGRDYNSNSHYNQFIAIMFDYGLIMGSIIVIILIFVNFSFLHLKHSLPILIILFTGEYIYNSIIVFLFTILIKNNVHKHSTDR